MIYKALTLFNALGERVLDNEILNIRGIKIPNFFKTGVGIQYEFCHQFVELYEDFLLNPDGYFSYENEEVQISEDDIVIDCGGNMGLFAAYAATKGATVYCFEPCQSIRDNFLSKTKDLYGDKITIVPYALGAVEGTETFLHTPNIGANHLAKYKVNTELPIIGSETVKVVTLDKFLEEHNIIPTIIKADVEGAEKDLLLGAKNIIRTVCPKMVISNYHTPRDIMHIQEIVAKINLNYNYIIRDNNSFFWI